MEAVVYLRLISIYKPFENKPCNTHLTEDKKS